MHERKVWNVGIRMRSEAIDNVMTFSNAFHWLYYAGGGYRYHNLKFGSNPVANKNRLMRLSHGASTPAGPIMAIGGGGGSQRKG